MLLASALTNAPREADLLAFYTVVATIIPVLCLGVVYEANVARVWDDEHQLLGFVSLATALGFAVWGETAALHAVAARYVTGDARILAGVAMALLGSLLFSVSLAESGRRLRGDYPDARREVIVAICAAMIVLVAVIGLDVAEVI